MLIEGTAIRSEPRKSKTFGTVHRTEVLNTPWSKASLRTHKSRLMAPGSEAQRFRVHPGLSGGHASAAGGPDP